MAKAAWLWLALGCAQQAKDKAPQSTTSGPCDRQKLLAHSPEDGATAMPTDTAPSAEVNNTVDNMHWRAWQTPLGGDRLEVHGTASMVGLISTYYPHEPLSPGATVLVEFTPCSGGSTERTFHIADTPNDTGAGSDTGP